MQLIYPEFDITQNGGPVVKANVATCTCRPDSDVFNVYQVAGQNHFHIECTQCEVAHCPFGVCNMKSADPVHFENGQWYFWDESWTSKQGPFPNEHVARKELERYAQWLNTGRTTP